MSLQKLYDRFDRYYIPEPNSGCWIWMGAVSGRGRDKNYGYMRVSKQRMEPAYAFSYMIHVGDPKGGVLDHRCDNPICVNPDHLLLTTHRENILRGKGTGAKFARRTHCSKGHLLAVGNLAPTKESRRRCLICYRLYQKQYRKHYRRRSKR